MSATLAIPAAKLALGAAGSVIGGLTNALDPAKAKAKKQADDFETMFLEQVTQQLTATAEGSEGPLGENGLGGGIYKSQLTQQYAKQIQKAGGLGLSDVIMRDLLRVQEQAAATTGKTVGVQNVGS
ncbi:MAG: flagellar biosynthesis protein FlgJ [Hyphomicrobiales bacterium]|nr:MAG: flagellar biosynthesis protein FlgJ [Hyphomicrobiales bacterium]